MSDTLKGGHHTPERTLMPTPLQILQLEDDPGDVRHIADLLRDANLSADITVAGSRAEFLTALARGGFDLVLADYQLPGFDGLQALALWRERTPDTPFLFVTGAMGEERAVESLKSGATDYILKENLARLVPAVRRALEEAEESACRLAAEGAVRAETERRHILFEQLPDGILVIDPETARFVEFNTTAHQQLGYSREEFARLTIHDLEVPETDAETKAHIAEANQTGSVDFETRHRTRQGEIRNVHVTAQLVSVAGQAVHQCVWRDITERKRAEADLLRTLATERKLSALKTTFETMVSHEFRTPLSTILGATEMLEDFYDILAPEKRAEYFEAIRREIQRLKGMLEKVLLQGRLAAGQVQFTPRATDVVAVCRDVLARVQFAFPKHPPVHFEADAPTHRTLADESLLECVLNNLLTNALKYSPALTPVRFAVRRVGEGWEMQVQDQGIGIDEADQAFVFSAFRRGGNVGNIKGTGVGLYLVKKCAELQGGRVELRSQVGQGSTFVFTFPWRPAETAPAVTL